MGFFGVAQFVTHNSNDKTWHTYILPKEDPKIM